MRAVDTNVLVRLLTRDDRRQAEAADAFVSGGAWVSSLVLAESIWVLESVYGLAPDALALAVEMLLGHQSLTLADAEAVEAAVKQFRQRPVLGFSDCLVLELARKAGHLPLGTFDRGSGKLAGAQRLP